VEQRNRWLEELHSQSQLVFEGLAQQRLLRRANQRDITFWILLGLIALIAAPFVLWGLFRASLVVLEWVFSTGPFYMFILAYGIPFVFMILWYQGPVVFRAISNAIASAHASDRLRQKYERAKGTFKINPDDVQAGLANVGHTFREYLGEAEEFLKSYSDRLFEREIQEIQNKIGRVQTAVQSFNLQPSDSNLHVAAGALNELQDILLKYCRGIRSSFRTSIAKLKIEYLEKKEKLSWEVVHLQRAHPQAWASQFTNLYKRVLNEDEYIIDKTELSSAIAQIDNVLQSLLPKAREALESRKQEEPIDWYVLMKEEGKL
jgi:uncharacterized membrane protein